MEDRGISADTVIMRSSGSLMSEAFATSRPIDTVLCGPAASLMGGAGLTGKRDCIVVDMGGTTTDIAIMRNGMGETTLGGVHIGRWKTFVDGLYVRTIGLGGDTAIHYQKGKLIMEDYRVIPICVGATLHPCIADYVKKVLPGERCHTKYLHEHLIFRHDPEPWMQLSNQEQRIVETLRIHPYPLRQISEELGIDLYTLPVDRLVEIGVVSLCGLTPTDIMHVLGDFDRYDRAASIAAAEYVANNLNITVEDLCSQVYEEVRWKLYRNIVLAIMVRQGLLDDEKEPGEDLERVLRHSYESSTADMDGTDMLATRFTVSCPLIGIGAPIGIFLPEVGRLLDTDVIIPEHHEVANALGAIMGSISTTVRTRVEPVNSIGESSYYMVFTASKNCRFEDKDEAIAYAIRDACSQAESEAIKRGAGEVDIADKPNAILQLSPSSPLFWGADTAEGFAAAAAAGVPLVILPEPMAGVSSPYSVAGLLTENTAEMLSGVVIAELTRPGTPVLYGASWTTYDMKYSCAKIGAPESALLTVAGCQMARFYGMPSHTTATNSDGNAHDEHQAWESVTNNFFAMNGGNDIVMNSGMFACGLTTSLEQLVMDNEVNRINKRLMAGIDGSDEQVAGELIKEVGPCGNFLMEDHTLDNLYSGEFWTPTINVNQSYDSWATEGYPTVDKVARKLVDKILAEGVKEELDGSIKDKLAAIIADFEKGE